MTDLQSSWYYAHFLEEVSSVSCSWELAEQNSQTEHIAST